MTDKTSDKELDALKADIARLREEIAGLVDGATKSSRMHAGQPHATAKPDSAAPNGEDPGVWTDLLHKFDASRVQGEKVVRDLAAEVRQHPLVSIVAAFGFGYIVAKLWYQKRTSNENTDGAH